MVAHLDALGIPEEGLRSSNLDWCWCASASGVEPILAGVAGRPVDVPRGTEASVSARRVRDEALKVKLQHVHEEHFGVYGARKLWRHLQREGIPATRCTAGEVVSDICALFVRDTLGSSGQS